MNRLPSLFALAVLLVLGSLDHASAQSPGAASANSAAYDLYSAGDYTNAAAAYDKLLKDYPSDAIVPAAQVQLAFCYYFLARYDDALAVLAKAKTAAGLSADLKQIIDGLIPQINLAKAAGMPQSDPKRRATFDEAIKGFSTFITTYPQSKDLENTILSRAIAEYQIKDYAATAKDLELNIQRFPQSSTIPTSKKLLAMTLATQGSEELNKQGAANKDAAFALYNRAATYLREIIDKKEDVALINDANFQLAGILFNEAVFSPEAERAPLFKQALEAYRAVAPKEQIVQWQKDVIKEFPEKKKRAVLSNNAELRKQLDKDNERELKKLGELEAQPDQVATAMLKMGEIFFQQTQMNQARVLLQHVAPYLGNDDDKKRALYFTTLTYAAQGAAEKAAAGYADFQAKYKGDALADNLPLSLGLMYLGLNQLPEAIKYFDESLALYPSGRFVGPSVVNKALAEGKAGKYDEASQTFKGFLAQNPPPETGVVAQYGLAGIYKDTKKWDDAIAAYTELKTKYAGTPQAEEGEYWIGFATQQKGDFAGSVPLLDAYAKAHPDSPFAPLAVYFKGAAQVKLNQIPEAIVTLAEVADKYPDSQPAPFTYFQRAQLQSGKPDDVIAVLRQFITKYPQSDRVFTAYESIALTQVAAQKTDDAIATYREFVEKYPTDPHAAECLSRVAAIQLDRAERLGRYGALNEEERKVWKTNMDSAVATLEELIQKYPDSPALAPALDLLLKAQRLQVAGELTKPEDVQAYFQKLADGAGSESAKSKILFTLALYLADQDEAKALAIMSSAYKPEIVFSPESLDFYGQALVKQGKYDEATVVFDNLAQQYPNPPGDPTKAPALIQNAQAIALFGKGSIAQAQKQTAQAGQIFQQLKALYPWSAKVLEANYGIAASLKEQKKYDEALQLLVGIVKSPNATAPLQANCMLLGGYIMLEKSKAATEQKEKEEFLGSAIDYFIKIAQLYSGVPDPAAEGLWMGSQLLEQQAEASTDAKFKTQQLGRAKAFYQQLVKDYPNSQYAPKAEERLKALPQ